jgi:diguanylate cyclase (GGDEF)-like protein
LFIFRFFYPFFFPGGLFLISGAFLFRSEPLLQLITPYLPLLFPVIFTLSLLLGLRFGRSRLIFALLFVALSLALGLLYPTQQKIYSVVALLLPLNLSLTLLLPEKRLGSSLSALYGSAILIQGLTLFGLEITGTENFLRILNHPLPFTLPLEIQPGMPQLAALSVSILISILCFRRRPQPLEAAFFWVILLTVLPFNLQLETQHTLLFFCLAVLALLTGLIESSHNMAYIDELTGIPGRRALNEALKRLGRRYSLAMLDIDHFKKFNDKHGHEVGDQVLKMVAGRLARVGGGGRAFRYGGEEFAVVFSGRKSEEVLTELEKLRRNVAAAAFVPRSKDRPIKKPGKTPPKNSTSSSLSVTISIGAAEPSPEQRSPELVLHAADQALYRAKQQGRNRLCC